MPQSPAAVNAAGGRSAFLAPYDQSVRGNTHMMMMDLNNSRSPTGSWRGSKRMNQRSWQREQKVGCRLTRGDPLFPITGFASRMHHGDDEYELGFTMVNSTRYGKTRVRQGRTSSSITRHRFGASTIRWIASSTASMNR